MSGWRDSISIHPAADLFPLLGADELREMADDIKANGLHEMVKIIERCRRRPDGSLHVNGPREQIVIDGRNRLDAMELAGLPIFRSGSTELRRDVADILEQEDGVLELDDRRIKIADYVVSINVKRRHLTTQQKLDLLDKVMKANPNISSRRVAKLVDVSPTTATKSRRKLESKGDVSTVDTATDTKGRQQPVKKPRVEPKECIIDRSDEPVASAARTVTAEPEVVAAAKAVTKPRHSDGRPADSAEVSALANALRVGLVALDPVIERICDIGVSEFFLLLKPTAACNTETLDIWRLESIAHVHTKLRHSGFFPEDDDAADVVPRRVDAAVQAKAPPEVKQDDVLPDIPAYLDRRTPLAKAENGLIQ